MGDNLKHKTVSGILWRGLETIGSSGAQFVVAIMLARMLLPEQFGLIAMLAIFVQLADVFVASGFPKALIQKEHVSAVDESSVFFFNLAVAVLLYGVLFVAAPWVAKLYDQPQLSLLLRVLSVRVVIGALGQIQQTLLTIKLEFKKQVAVGWVSMLISGCVGVLMAWKGFGVWALVVQQLLSSAIRTGMLWFVSPWRPAFIFDLVSLRSMFSFGSKLLASSLIDTALNNIYLVVIGKIFNPVVLGFYHRAHSLPSLLMNSINGTVAYVMFPSYASIQNDTQRIKRAAQRSLKMLYFIVMPIMVGLAVVAEPLVKILLTDKWLPCVPYLQVLSIVYATGPIQVVNLQIIMALGRSDIFFRLEVIKAIIDAGMIIATYRFGIFAMVLGQMVTSMFSVVLNAYYNGEFIRYPVWEQLRDLFPTIGISTLMAAVVWLVGRIGIESDLIRLCLQVICGATAYILMCNIVKLDGYQESVTILRERLIPSKKKF